MKKLTGLMLLFILCETTSAQNFIPNGDFESYINLPTGYGQIGAATGWNNCFGSGDAEYFNTAAPFGSYFGTLTPHSGSGMAGLCTYHSGVPGLREYLGTQLSQPLIAGTQYRVSFYLSSGVGGGYTEACNRIGVAFSSNPFIQSGNQTINVIPQVELTDTFCLDIWQQFVFYYTPVTNEQYLAFGNFRTDLNTYHTFCHAGSVMATYYFVDDIVVELATGIPTNSADSKILFAPNPFHDFVELTCSNCENNDAYECEILDLTGKLVNKINIYSGKTIIPTQELSSGIYFYRVRNKSGIITLGKLLKE